MTTSSEKTYFDLHTTGIGYLGRIREVKPKKADSFLACDISALVGEMSKDTKPEYRRFDLRVSGTEAQHLVRRCEQAVNDDRKVLVKFRLGDLWTDIFTHEKGKNAGQQGVSLKARLLWIGWIKIDGKLIYKAEPKAEKPDDSNQQSSNDSSPGDETDAATGSNHEPVASDESLPSDPAKPKPKARTAAKAKSSADTAEMAEAD